MLKFFRQIRHKMLTENRASKYLLYAAGEILLVVIGILIALQINNWNEEQKNRSKEQQYLAALKLEIATNINRLNQEIERNENHIKAAKEIATMIALNNQPKDETTFSSQLRKIFVDDAVFTPKNTIINEIESTGSLKIIQNKLLREFIADWRSTLIKLKEHEKGALDFKHTCGEVFQNNGNIKVIFDDTGLTEFLALPKGHSGKSNQFLLDAPKFENYLLLFIAVSNSLNEIRYQPLLKTLEKMKDTIQKN